MMYVVDNKNYFKFDKISDPKSRCPRANAYDDLRKMRGKIKFSINLSELRKDRDTASRNN